MTSSRLAAMLLLATAACAPVDAPPPGTPAGAGPAMPPEIASCEASEEGSYGAWVPSIDEVALAAPALGAYCVPPKVHEAAVRACAAKLGRTTMKLGVGDEKAGKMCWESLVPAEQGGRRWIAAHYFYQNGGQFAGSGVAVELRDGRAALYLENDGLGAACDAPATAPAKAPADFSALPADLARVLCGWNSK
jgi:hypothetical protein